VVSKYCFTELKSGANAWHIFQDLVFYDLVFRCSPSYSGVAYEISLQPFRKSNWIFLFLPSGEIPQGKIADWDWPRYGELLGSFSPQLVDLRWFLEDRKFQQDFSSERRGWQYSKHIGKHMFDLELRKLLSPIN
jgi:hypothetical protein